MACPSGQGLPGKTIRPGGAGEPSKGGTVLGMVTLALFEQPTIPVETAARSTLLRFKDMGHLWTGRDDRFPLQSSITPLGGLSTFSTARPRDGSPWSHGPHAPLEMTQVIFHRCPC